MRQNNHLALLTFLTGCLGAMPAKAEERQEEPSGGRTSFVYGGECNQLSALNRHEIQAVTHGVHTDSFDRFCFAQGIYSCSDYTAQLRGAGSLAENDSFGCTFVPDKR
jgi:hypothetical protein